LWSLSNFDFSYSLTQTKQHNPLTENNEVAKTQGGVGYNYSKQPKYIEPIQENHSNPKQMGRFYQERKLQSYAIADWISDGYKTTIWRLSSTKRWWRKI